MHINKYIYNSDFDNGFSINGVDSICGYFGGHFRHY